MKISEETKNDQDELQYTIEQSSIASTPKRNGPTTRNTPTTNINSLIIKHKFTRKIDKIKLFHEDNELLFEPKKAMIVDMESDINNTNNNNNNNNNSNNNNNFIKTITQEFSQQLQQKDSNISILESKIKKLRTQLSTKENELKKFKKNEKNSNNSIEKIQNQLAVKRNKVRILQQKLQRAKSSTQRFRKKSAMITNTRKSLGQMSRMNVYRIRKNTFDILKDMHRDNKQEIAQTISHAVDKDKENVVANELAKNTKITQIKTIFINTYSKKLLTEEDVILQQMITKYNSGISESQWDNIKFGVHYHRDVIINKS